MSNQSILNRPMGKGWRTPFKSQGSGFHLGRVWECWCAFKPKKNYLREFFGLICSLRNFHHVDVAILQQQERHTFQYY
jgi:hypothetical protein